VADHEDDAVGDVAGGPGDEHHHGLLGSLMVMVKMITCLRFL
jgi:hypothetical protein